MSHLVRARQANEDAATQRLSFARRSQARAHAQARVEGARIDAMTTQRLATDTGAFVAAAVALQSAAATHAAAVGEAERADSWVVEREREMTEAAIARRTAEELRENAQKLEDARAARAAQLALDEAAAATHERRRSEP